jgi:hypothetical protein
LEDALRGLFDRYVRRPCYAGHLPEGGVIRKYSAKQTSTAIICCDSILRVGMTASAAAFLTALLGWVLRA